MMVLPLSTFALVNSSFAGQFFVGASANMQTNTSNFTADAGKIIQVQDPTKLAKLKSELDKLESDLATEKQKQKDFLTAIPAEITAALTADALLTSLKNISVETLTTTNNTPATNPVQTTLGKYLSTDLNISDNEIKKLLTVNTANVKGDSFLTETTIDTTNVNTFAGNNAIGDLQTALGKKIQDTVTAQGTTNVALSTSAANLNTAIQAEYVKALNDLLTNSKQQQTDLATNISTIGNNVTTKQGDINTLPKDTDFSTKSTVKEGSVSKLSPAVSLMAGYKTSVEDFGFITELGTDIAFSNKIGSKDKNEIEAKKGLSVYLTQKVGYHFAENNLTYLTLGVSMTKYSLSHSKIKDASKTLVQPIIGAGHEFAINENLSAFTEFNIHLAGKINVNNLDGTQAGNVKLSTQQFKIGARYYM